MKKRFIAALFSLLCAAAAFAGDGLDGFLGNLNVQARADLPGFSIRVSNQFGVPEVQVRAVLGQVGQPADAFMIFQLGQMSHQPSERVLHVYQSHKGKGWGVVAKELGIKPGSPEFHALKRGDFRLAGASGDERHNGQGHGQGQDQGQGQGHGHGQGHGKHGR